jgi:hypothetical protein
MSFPNTAEDPATEPTSVPDTARITRGRKDALKASLCEWQLPESMLRLVASIPSDPFLTQAGLEFLQDAWIGAEFARLRHVPRVRLIADTRPDFEIEIDGRVDRFEAVEVLEAGRRRGDEYRAGGNVVTEFDPIEDWVARADHAPRWIEEACRKKASMGYDPLTNLIVYLNLGEYGVRQKEIERSFETATAGAKERFHTLWILWKQHTYLVWEEGRLRLC